MENDLKVRLRDQNISLIVALVLGLSKTDSVIEEYNSKRSIIYPVVLDVTK